MLKENKNLGDLIGLNSYEMQYYNMTNAVILPAGKHKAIVKNTQIT